VTFADFVACHVPALERNEVRHNLLLGILARFAGEPPAGLFTWSGDAPGQCAMQAPGWPIILGELGPGQCRRLAEETRHQAYPGVVGPDETARWLVERAVALGLVFEAPMPQQIHQLSGKPRYPGAPGRARHVTPADVELLADWLAAFHREAVPHDPAPARERVIAMAASGHYRFWEVEGAPVAMAGMVRESRNVAAIAAVYTPASLRGRGYGGSVTAAVSESIFARGKTHACLYTDLRNPFSNRCYAKVGFTPVCASWHIPRLS